MDAEKIRLNFGIKKCQKDDYYQIKVSTEDKSLGNTQNFETETIKCSEDGKEIIFQNSIDYFYHFEKKQKLTINIIKKILAGKNYRLQESERHTVLASMVASPNSTYERPLKNDKNSDILCIKLNRIALNDNDEYKSIFEYLKAGVKLSCFMSMDFSYGINGQNLLNSYNNYKKIINSIMNKISNYTKNEYFMYGYGANLKNKNLSNSLYKLIFNLNLEEDKSIKYENFNKKFDNCLNYIVPEKTVCLSLMIKKITKDIFQYYDEKFYNVLFVLARELTENKDRQNIIDAFIESGYLPLTIIIIGEGKNNFENMKGLFGKKIKQSSQGMTKNRDNIIFISYSDDFKENSDLLSEWCLREISRQMLQFYKLSKCPPNYIQKNSIGNIRNSINNYKQSYVQYESKILEESQFETPGYVIPEGTTIIGKGQAKNMYADPKVNSQPNNQINDGQNITWHITPQDSVNPMIKPRNIYQEQNSNQMNQREQPKNNNMMPKDKNSNNYPNQNPENNQNKNKYIITPGQSIREEINNPYIRPEEEKETPGRYFIPTQDSVCVDLKNNPYGPKVIETPHGPNHYYLQGSVSQPNEKTIINPYNSGMDKGKPISESGGSGYISTSNTNDNSNSNINNNESSNRYMRMNNYSIDSSQIK